MSMQAAMQLAVQSEIEALRVRSQTTLEDLEARADKLHERHRIAAREATTEAEHAWVQQLADWISMNDRRQQQAIQIALASTTLRTEAADVARDYSDPTLGLQGIRARIGLLSSVIDSLHALTTEPTTEAAA